MDVETKRFVDQSAQLASGKATPGSAGGSASLSLVPSN
jgi:hypothetical protein